MRIDANGRVGIGTSLPDYRLDVENSASGENILAEFTSDFAKTWNTTNREGILLNSKFTGQSLYWNTALIHWGYANTIGNGGSRLGFDLINVSGDWFNVMTMTGAGNVGIGTTAPSQKFHVNGIAQLDSVSFGITPGESQALALTTVEYVNTKVGGSGGVAIGTTNQTLRHNGAAWVATSNLFHDGSTVGIGTTNLGTGNKLIISGGALSLSGAFKGYGDTNNNFFEGKLGVFSMSAGAASLAVNGNAAIGAGYFSDAAPANGLIVQGNVGIGTSAPSEKLHLIGTMRIEGGMNFIGTDPILNNVNGTVIANKITANTIDPLYTINGIKYSTFAPAVVGGVKEEYVNRVYAQGFKKILNEYEYIIDFSKVKEGSDLWVWHRVVDFSDDNVEIFLTPRNQANMYAFIDGSKLIIRSNQPADASLRLVGKRYDWRDWPTKALDQYQLGGLVLE